MSREVATPRNLRAKGVILAGQRQQVGTFPSGGVQPTSITEFNGVLYVLNAGGTPGITGFRLQGGRLAMTPGCTRPLSGSGVGAAQVQFTGNGSKLVVTDTRARVGPAPSPASPWRLTARSRSFPVRRPPFRPEPTGSRHAEARRSHPTAR